MPYSTSQRPTLLLALVGLLSICTTALAQGPDSSQGSREKTHAEDVKRLVQPLVDSELVPSLVVGLYDDGNIEIYGFGRTGAPDGAAPSGKTLYEVGSITKVFTGVLLADAVLRKEVALDDPLGKFLPKEITAPKYEGQPITLRHLATHRSSLPRVPDNMAAADRDPYAKYDRAKLFEFLDGHRLGSAPDTSYAYSNLGMGLLGEILASNAKTDYEKLLGRVTGPLKMVDTTVTLSKEQKKRRAAPSRDGVPATPWHFDALCGCGGIRSTVDDLMKFIVANIELDSTPLKAPLKKAAEKITDNMGLGWHWAQDGMTIWHNGQTGGYSSGMFVAPSAKKAVVVLSNGASTQIDVVSERLIQLLFGMKVEPPKVRIPAKVKATDLEKLVGDFVSAEFGFTITVTREGDTLLARLTNQEAYRVFPESPTKFFYRVVPAELQFELDDKGQRATAVTLLQGGREMRCPRKS